MEKPREICSAEEFDDAHRSTKSKGGIRPSRSREELDQIIELLDRQSTRTRDFQHQGKNNFPWTKPVTLKQALRRSCISHASEAAAMRKLSRPKVLSEISDAGAVKVEEKRKLLEISEASEQRRAAFSRLLRLKKASETEYYEDEAKKGSPPRGEQRIREKGECSQSSKSSSSSTSNSEESEKRRKPHMSRDLRWIAIRRAEMDQGGIRLKNFKLLRRLGCGDIGTVYVARLVGSECLYALKVMDEEFLWSRMKMPRAETEREILQMLDHPFLPTLYAHFSEDNLSCLVMEYCPGGDLHVLRQKQPLRSFPEPAARFYVAEVLLALEYLHMLGVIYRDLKPENILVREDGHIMLSDFDLSLRCSVAPVLLRSSLSTAREIPADVFACADPLCSVSCLPAAGRIRSRDRAKSLPMLVAEPTEARSNSFVGTHEYLAPEIIKGEGHGSSVDWWTLGIFLYELLCGRTPFKGASDEETLTNIATQDLRFPETFTATIQARDLIRRLLIKDPARRIGSVRGAAEIKRHCFFDGLNWALIRSTVPPDSRSAAEEFAYPVAAPSAACGKKQSRCLDFGNDEIRHFGLF